MEIKKLAYILCAALAVFSTSCKKDDDTETYNTLSGSMSFLIPTFVGAEETYTLTPTGVTHPEGENLGYYWRASWKSANDTTKYVTDLTSNDGSITLTMPEDVGEYTITGAAYATGYSYKSATATFYVVKDAIDSTLSDTGIVEGDEALIDVRDDREYYITNVGGKVWLKQNLAFEGSGIAYLDCPSMSYIFGRYYNWDEAMAACPSGWHLSTAKDWQDLAAACSGGITPTADGRYAGIAGQLMVTATFFGDRMWEFWPAVNITNSTGFTAIPAGYGIFSGTTSFDGLYYYAAFWTAQEEDAEKAQYRYINVNLPDVMLGYGDKKSFRASVRCVQDD